MAGKNLSNVAHIIDDKAEQMSAVSRISYLFKFTQQSILVVDESTDFGAVGREYLGELEQVNAALVTVSQKMTDIQMRCRIIEQLAPNTIFDPEKPLSDTVVNLLEQKDQPLTIVIENAQYLSTAMISELLNFPKQFKSLRPSSHCDLLLIGDKSAHAKCHDMQASNGFDLVSICADSGKLYVPSEPLSKEPAVKKVSFVGVFVVVLALLIAASILMMVQTSQNKPTELAIAESDVNSSESQLVAFEPRVQLQPKKTQAFVDVATSQDIFTALVPNSEEVVSEAQVPSAVASAREEVAAVEMRIDMPSQKEESLSAANESMTKPLSELHQLLLDAKSGVVIQFASLSNEKAALEFIKAQAKTIELAWYPKLIAEQQYYVVISELYADRVAARAALNKLPTKVKSQGLWLKDIQLVKKELNAYLDAEKKKNN